MADKTIPAKSVLTVNLNSVFKQLHDIALAAAEKVDKNYGIVNTLFDNKTGDMRGSGEFLIMTVGNDTAKEKGIDNAACAKVLQTYVEKFAGPDAAKKISGTSISEIQSNEDQAEQEEKAEEEKEAAEDAEDEANKDDDIEERGEEGKKEEQPKESITLRSPKQSLLKMLFEADPSAGKDEDPEGPDQEDIDQQNDQTDAAGEEVEAADKDKEEDEEKAKEEKDAADAEHEDNEKRGITGYSAPYRVNIKTVKTKSFKFDDALEDIGNDLKNGVLGKALAWIWNDLKKSHVVLPGGNLKIGAALKVVDAAVDAMYQTIDAKKIDNDFRDSMRKKFPNANVDCRVFRNNEILKTLQNQDKLTPTMQSKINKAKLALVVKVTRDDPSFEKYDEKLIAEIFNKSIDTHLISKLKIGPKDVIRVEHATDNYKDKTIYDNPKSDRGYGHAAAGGESKAKKESIQSFYEYFLVTEALLAEDDVEASPSDNNPDADKAKKKEAKEADKAKVSEIQTFIYQEAKKEIGDNLVETKFAPVDEVVKYLQSKGMNDNKIIHDLQEHAYSMYIDVVEQESPESSKEENAEGSEEAGNEEKNKKEEENKPAEPEDEENRGDKLEDRDEEEEQLGTGESLKPRKSKLMKLIFEDVIEWKKATSDENNGSIAQKIEKIFENLIYKFIPKDKDADVPTPFVITYDSNGNIEKESIESKDQLLHMLFEDLVREKDHKATDQKKLVKLKKMLKASIETIRKHKDEIIKQAFTKDGKLLSWARGDEAKNSGYDSFIEAVFDGPAEEAAGKVSKISSAKNFKNDIIYRFVGAASKFAADEEKKKTKVSFFDADPETGEKTGDPLAEIEVEEGTPINATEKAQETIEDLNKKLQDNVKKGFVNKGWDPDVTQNATGESIEIVAKYIKEDEKDKEYTVIFQYAPDQEKPDQVEPVKVDGKDEVKVKAGEKVTPPEAPEIEGYKFKEWDTDGISLDNITNDVMALAKYSKNIKIVPKAPKDPEKPEETEQIGDPIEYDPEKPLKEQLPEPPTFDGWGHTDWNPDPDSVKDPTEDIEITATYEKAAEEEEEKDEPKKTKGRIYVIPDSNNLSGADPEKSDGKEGDGDEDGEVVKTDLFIIPHPKMKYRDEKNQVFRGDNKSGIAS